MSKFKQQYKKDMGLSLSNVKLHNIGHEVCDPSHNWSGFREFYSIHHIINGKGIYVVNNHSYELTSGDTFLIYPDTKVSYTADTDEPWEYLWLGISGIFVKDLMDFTKFSSTHPIIYKKDNISKELTTCLLSIYNSYGNSFEKEIELIGLVYIFLSKLMEKDTPYTQDTYDNYARQAKEYIELNYGTAITVNHVATKLNISLAHLHRIFSIKFGFSPGKYINKLRIDRASFLLRNTPLTISEISNSVGFENQLYFSNVFKKIKGKSPTNYRKENQDKELNR